jgi:FAD/FMN-containing dehydrogenase/Fe-S oxidoreductase
VAKDDGVDEQQRIRIRDDLQGFFQGELLFDEVTRILYSTDASIFQVRPAGVVIPRHEEDVRALVRYAYENRVPLIPRGAGTGMAGESLGSGLIVDLAPSFREIVDVGNDTVRAQPGVTLEALNRRLAEAGRRFAPDPAAPVCTVGGMLATNASGSRLMAHGYTRDHVQALRAVLDNGDAIDIAAEPWPMPAGTAADHWHDILAVLAVMLEENRELIDAARVRTAFDRCGYQLRDVLTASHLDATRLLVGSEGTLALFTEATLRTVPLPGGRSMVLAGFAHLEAALRATRHILDTAPTACELLERRLLSLARGAGSGSVYGSGAALWIDPAAEAALLIEYERDSLLEAEQAALELIQRLHREEPAVVQVVPALTEERQVALRRLRDSALPSLYGVKAGAQPVPFIEDVGVPVDALPEYLRRLQETLQENDVTASFLVHAGTGQVHARPFLNLGSPDDIAKLSPLAERVHELALELGGTVSTQHGTGLARTPWVARQFGALYPILRQVKAIFDPRGIFNPGKIVDPDVSSVAWPVRQFANRDPEPRSLRWPELQVCTETNHCNGCGQCRTEQPGTRMCPIFRATHHEAAAPRAKANLLRQLLSEPVNGLTPGSDAVRAVADLCVNCKMCALECPAHVNIPKLMLEAKAANVAQHGLDRHHWFFARLAKVAAWGSSMPLFFNLLLQTRPTRWLFSKLFGLAPRRRLPRFARRTFLNIAERRGWTEPSAAMTGDNKPRVALFVDLYANHFDPSLGEAALRVLQHHGFDVLVPAGQKSSGIEALSHGDVDTARDFAAQNLQVFAELAREGVPIVCLEPSAALMLRHEYLELMDGVDARLVAEQAVEFTTFLNRLERLRDDFSRPLDVSVAHHVPCHLKALQGPVAGPKLLSAIPGVKVRTIDVSCSGMAGTFGLQARNYQTSLAAGQLLLAEVGRPEFHAAAAECSSCRMQMEDGAGKRALHPAQYLALAYGLMPELAPRLQQPLRPLVL